MTVFAYLDASSNVVATSASAIPVASVQASRPELNVVSRIDGAPDEIRHVSGATASSQTYHRHESGDGTELAHYSEQGGLELHRDRKNEAIDARTDELIALGFSFAGKQFSLSRNAQLRLVGINQERANAAVTYPVRWNTIADDEVYEIADADEFESFYLTAMGTYRGHVDSGTVIKDAVRAATTISEIDAVQDTR